MTDNPRKRLVIDHAIRDAVTHQRDFPGQPLDQTDDWDSAAYQEVAVSMRLSDEERERYWTTYRRALNDEIRAAIERQG